MTLDIIHIILRRCLIRIIIELSMIREIFTIMIKDGMMNRILMIIVVVISMMKLIILEIIDIGVK